MRHLAEERQTEDAAGVHRTDGDLRHGIFITAAGLSAIGAGDDAGEQSEQSPALTPTPPPRTSKSSTVIALLERAEGATLPGLIAATGWLPHTTRAALTGSRKKGHVLDKAKRDGITCCRIVR